MGNTASDPLDKILKLITEQSKQIATLKELREKNSTAIANLTKEVERVSQSLEEQSSAKATCQSVAKVPRHLSRFKGLYNI